MQPLSRRSILKFAGLAVADTLAGRARFAHPLRFGSCLATQRRAELLEQHAQESSLANQTRAAWRQISNIEAQSGVLSLRSQEYRSVGDRVAADESVAGAISVLESLPRSANLAMAYNWRSLLAVNRGWEREALEFGQRALRASRPS